MQTHVWLPALAALVVLALLGYAIASFMKGKGKKEDKEKKDEGKGLQGYGGGIQAQKKVYDPWVPNPFVDKYSEEKNEGRGPIPIDGFELFEHGDNKGDRLDFVENEQLIKGSGVRGANWSGVIDLWSPEGLKTWSWPETGITNVTNDPSANHNNADANGKVQHGYRFDHPVMQGLFDLVMNENVIFQRFSPKSPTINLQKFTAVRTGVEKDEDEEDMEKFIEDSLIG